MNKAKYDIATPYTAVYVIFRRGNEIALLLRENTEWMNHHFCLPAGRVEHGESFLVAAAREAEEEVGIKLAPSDLKPLLSAHRLNSDSLWVDLFFEAQDWKGELHNAEPDVHSEIAWFDIDKLPDNLVPGLRESLQAIQDGKIYTEIGWQV